MTLTLRSSAYLLLGVVMTFILLSGPKVLAVELPIRELHPIDPGMEIDLKVFLNETIKKTGRDAEFSPGAETAITNAKIDSEELNKVDLKLKEKTPVEEITPGMQFEEILKRNSLFLFFDGVTPLLFVQAESLPEIATLDGAKLPTLEKILVPRLISQEEFNTGITRYPEQSVPKIIITGPGRFRVLVKKFVNMVQTDPVVAPLETYRWETRKLKHTFAGDFAFAGADDKPFKVVGIITKLKELAGFEKDTAHDALFFLSTSPPGQSASQPASLRSETRNQGATQTELLETQVFGVNQRAADEATQRERNASDPQADNPGQPFEIRNHTTVDDAREQISILLKKEPENVLGFFRLLPRSVQSALILDLTPGQIDELHKHLPDNAKAVLDEELKRDPLKALGEKLELGVKQDRGSKVKFNEANPVLHALINVIWELQLQEQENNETADADKVHIFEDFAAVAEEMKPFIETTEVPEKILDLAEKHLDGYDSEDLTFSLVNAFQKLTSAVQMQILQNLDPDRVLIVQEILTKELGVVFMGLREKQREAEESPMQAAMSDFLKGNFGSNENDSTSYEDAQKRLKSYFADPTAKEDSFALSKKVFGYYQTLRPDIQERLIKEAASDRLAEIRDLLDDEHRAILENIEKKVRGAISVAVTTLPPIMVSNVKRSIFADKSQNAIVMFDTDSNIRFYNSVIDQLDRPIKLVEISIAIVDINTDSGFEWNSNLLYAGAGQHDGKNITNVSGFRSSNDLSTNLPRGNSQVVPRSAPDLPLPVGRFDPYNVPPTGTPINGYDNLGNPIPLTTPESIAQARLREINRTSQTTTFPYLPASSDNPITSAIEAGLVASDKFSASTLIVGSTYRILSRIETLETKGDARIISRPMVMTLDNVQAVFDDKVNLHIPVGGLENSELFKINAGIKIQVQPHIIDVDGEVIQIRIAVHIEDGNTNPTGADPGFSIPNIQKSTITTQAVVPENQSLMIGGRHRKFESRTESRIPFLGKIPIIGLPFKNKNVVNSKVQRFFLITPKIIDPVQAYQSDAERAHDIVNEGSRPVADAQRVVNGSTGLEEGAVMAGPMTRPEDGDIVASPATQNEWNQANEALIFDADRAGDMPGQPNGKPKLGFFRKLFHKKAKDH